MIWENLLQFLVLVVRIWPKRAPLEAVLLGDQTASGLLLTGRGRGRWLSRSKIVIKAARVLSARL